MNATLILSSCKDNNKSDQSKTLRSDDSSIGGKDSSLHIKQIDSASKNLSTTSVDWTKIDFNSYSFSLDDSDRGTNGSAGFAYYKNDKIKKIVLTIFGEMGQYKITYSFLKEKQILLSEKHFAYLRGIDSVKSDSDMQLDENVRYPIDYNGNRIDSKKSEATVGIIVFPEVKKIVPFKLPETH